MKDVKIYHAWIGAGLMGVGLSAVQATEDALQAARSAGIIRPSLGDGDSPHFETEREFCSALDIGAEWLSECSQTVLNAIDTREIPE